MTRKKSNKSVDVPISSMIDIVFLLIIFFVVTATVDNEIQDEAIRLANAPHGKPVGRDLREVTVNVQEDGTLTVGGREITPDALSVLLRNAGTQYGSNFPVVIRGDRQTQHENIKRVIKQVQQTGLYQVKLRALKKE